MNLFEYLDKHTYIAIIFWIGVIPYLSWCLVIISNRIFDCIERMAAASSVKYQGWPPEHLDARGDYYITNEEEDKEP